MADYRWRERDAQAAAVQFLIRYYGLGHKDAVLASLKKGRRALGAGRD